MKNCIRSVMSSATWLAVTAAGLAIAQPEPPTEWIEPETGHRVVRLSREPDSQSLYFHQYPYSADGKKVIFTRRDGIYTVDLHTREIAQVVEGRVQVLVTGRKSGDVYFIRRGGGRRGDAGRGDTGQRDNDRSEDEARGAGPDSTLGAVARYSPPISIRTPSGKWQSCRNSSAAAMSPINADETMIVAIGRDPDGKAVPRTPPDGRFEGRLLPAWASGAPRVLYTIDIASGESKVIHRSNDWLNHLQCSPTDPQQIMFCHEGPWHFVDRVWLIRTDGSDLKLVHPRTMDMEIAGHEFFGDDGRTVWYDLQTPRSLVFWLAKYDLETKARTWYHLERNAWSVHFNVSPDGTMMAGDGGGPASVANLTPSHERLDPPGNGQWIYLFRPELVTMTGLPENAAKQVKTGVLKAERLVDLSKHDYDLEPNVTFTPDGKWIVFRSNMHGPTHVYMVEVAKSQ